MDYASLSGNRVQVTFTLDEPAESPSSFKTMEPARVALDFSGVSNRMKRRRMEIGVGAVESVATAEAGDRTRAVIRLSTMVPYEVSADGNNIRVLLAAPGMKAEPSKSSTRAASTSGSSTRKTGKAPSGAAIEKVDFERTENGAGRITTDLSDPSIPVDVRREGDRVVADFVGARAPERLLRRLDVTDFATPVSAVETRSKGDGTRVTILTNTEFEQIAYQTDESFTIEIKPFSREEDQKRARDKKRYTGEKLSLNFQDIEVRSVLQLLADFTGLNMVVSDSVSGNITLRLDDVPWDQALDIILQAKGLDKRRTNNVLWIAPAEEIANRERIEAEARQQQKQLAPLRSEFIEVSYAKAATLAKLIRGGEGENSQSLLSDRGSVSIDERTNTLIVQDTATNLTAIRELVSTLDIPVRQVLIESRVVIADDNFTNELGVQFGYSRQGELGDQGIVIGGTKPGDTNFGGTTAFEVEADSGNEGLIVDLPAAGAAGQLGLAVGKIGSYLLQLELSAMENEGRGEIISSPKVITANQREAFIKQGEEIPYETVSEQGTSVQFKEAVLGLTVTPQITPDDRVLLDLEVSKDSRGEDTDAGPAIDTQAVGTQVLVDNGETVVLGGVYERNKRNDVTRVPFFGELPVLGHLFRKRTTVDNNRELLIFVTPKILEESLSLR
ncbi:type IV pilus secretin PilQ [Arhodomonas sp. AD133]|uniref:type IV pilus secretin PilQ n=1 Tax=Arhodomonas sp. AD133 TaxID=3415009 RepID=UPI003EC07491